jgi:hypothetical protein
VEAKGLEPSNLLTASQALYQLSYAPRRMSHSSRTTVRAEIVKATDLRFRQYSRSSRPRRSRLARQLML